jgi:outer membrane protein assembly factor BamB
VVWGDRIFLTAAVSSETTDGEYSLRAMCLAGDTGKPTWDVEVFQETSRTTQRIHNKNSHASPTPVTDGKRLFVHFGAHGTACLDLDGQILWKNTGLNYPMNHGSGGSPVLVDDLLFFSCDGSENPFVVALDQATGKIRWKKDRPSVANRKKFSFATALAIDVDGETQIISPGTDQVVAYRPKDGEKIWSVGFAGYSVIPRPVYAEGLLFVSTSYDSPVAMAISPDGTGDLTATNIAWQNRKAAPHTPSLLAVGSEVYMVSDGGVATCVDAKSGKVHWQERIGGKYSASPVYGDGRIYFQSEEGEGVVIKAGPVYEELARNNLNARTLASYAVIGSDLLIRTDEGLFRITAGR